MLEPRYLRLLILIIGFFPFGRHRTRSDCHARGFYRFSRRRRLTNSHGGKRLWIISTTWRKTPIGVELEIRGNTTEGLDFALVVISSPDNLGPS